MAKENGCVTRSFLDALPPNPLQHFVVPEWEGKRVYIRMMNGRERAELLARYAIQKDGTLGIEQTADMAIRLLCKTIVDSKGERLFADSEMDKLSDKLGASFDDLALLSMKHSGIGGDDSKKKKQPKRVSTKGSRFRGG